MHWSVQLSVTQEPLLQDRFPVQAWHDAPPVPQKRSLCWVTLRQPVDEQQPVAQEAGSHVLVRQD